MIMLTEKKPFIYPFMRYTDARGAIDFLCRAFGFEQAMLVPGEGDTVAHAQLRLGDGMIMLGTGQSPKMRGAIPDDIKQVEQGLYVYVQEPDKHCERARSAGARILREPENTEYGSREYSAVDTEGYYWSFGTYHPAAEEGAD
jgi:uncharacterized glyoxalase superfamily protein PhnB